MKALRLCCPKTCGPLIVMTILMDIGSFPALAFAEQPSPKQVLKQFEKAMEDLQLKQDKVFAEFGQKAKKLFAPGETPGGVVNSINVYRRSSDSGHLFAAKYMPRSDGGWLLFSLYVPVDQAPLLRRYISTWLFKIDDKGELPEPGRWVAPPFNKLIFNYDLAATTLGVVRNKHTLYFLNPDGVVWRLNLNIPRDKSLNIEYVTQLNAEKLARKQIPSAKQVTFFALDDNGHKGPVVIVGGQKRNNETFLLPVNLSWQELCAARTFKNVAPKVSPLHFMGRLKTTQTESWIAYDPESNDILRFVRSGQIVQRHKLMTDLQHRKFRHGVDFYVSYDRFDAERQRIYSSALNQIAPGSVTVPEVDRVTFASLSIYGDVHFSDKLRVNMEGLFQLVRFKNANHVYYIEFGKGKLRRRELLDKGLGPVDSIPTKHAVVDYRLVASDKDLYLFTMEDKDFEGFMYRAYQFNGSSWKQLPDWHKPYFFPKESPSLVMSLLTRPVLYDGVLQLFVPVLQGKSVSLYYCQKSARSVPPKVGRVRY